MKEKSSDIGVIVGRFQINNLHSEHIKLIEYVLERHSKTIIFLGTSIAIGTRRNPLDFITRKMMLEDHFQTRISTILPLPDSKSDFVWSNNLDSKIREVFPSGSVTIYGGKDSFIPYYKGKFETCQLVPDTYISAVDIRSNISKKTLSSADFRHGIIYATYAQYPIMFSTVDIAILDGKGNLLLARKPNEVEWRFCWPYRWQWNYFL